MSFAGGTNRPRERGQALLIALGLVFLMSILVAGTQLQVTGQLGKARTERDYDRALTMAEAGLNAFLNRVSNGAGVDSAGNPVTNSGLVPTVWQWPTGGAVPTVQEVRGYLKAHTSPYYGQFITYPSGSTSGYIVGYLGSYGPNMSIISFGWSNGVMRRVMIPGGGLMAFSVFDWAAIYGIDPLTTTGSGPNNGPAWTFTGSANVVGASGGEGFINGNNNVSFYNGPIILAAAGSTLNPTGSFNPTVTASYAMGSIAYPNGLPTGCPTNGTVAVPAIRRIQRSLNMETADLAANLWANQVFGTSYATPVAGSPVIVTPGVGYFKTNHNNNATGIRMLVKVTKSTDANYGKIRELATPYVIPTSGNGAYVLSWPKNTDFTGAGMTSNETAVGIRVYPGNYYFQQITQSTADQLWVRSYNDTDFPSGTTTSSTQKVYKWDWSTANPTNPNAASGSFSPTAERNVRFWVGSTGSNSGDPNSSFGPATYMEYPAFSSRFRVYVASQGTMTVSGTNTYPPPLFRVNMLAYNYGTMLAGSIKGQTMMYGDVSIASGTYLFGSLIGWKVSVAGGCTVEKQAAEGGDGSDKLTYLVSAWTELP